MKSVLLIVVDALTNRLTRPLMEAGNLPNLSALAKRAQINSECISVFPSITHAALSSLVTGVYPNAHKVMGSHWYIKDEDRVAFFSADIGVIFNKGLNNFVEEYLLDLNGSHLEAKTLYQRVENAGYTAACINYLIFKGNEPHTFNLPKLLDWIPLFPDNSETVYGPKHLFLGHLVHSQTETIDTDKADESLEAWYGLRDEFTASVLQQYAEQRAFPALTVAYFPANDDLSHRNGPESGHAESLKFVDKSLGELCEAYGGLDALLDDLSLIIVGDHSQSAVLDETTAAIKVNEILESFQCSLLGNAWSENDDLMVCPNMRAVQIYFKEGQLDENFQEVQTLLCQNEKIDQVIWRQNEAYQVATASDSLRFWRGKEGSQTAVDQFGNQWSWEGDLSAVDGQKDEQGRLHFPTYPNAFERIAGALDNPNSGELWATAEPGYEFTLPEAVLHANGGSHGSLHKLDSLSFLVAAGLPPSVRPPEKLRVVDIAPLCLEILQINESQ